MRKIKPDYFEAVQQTGVLEKLSAFQPEIAGTAPLGLSTEDSDIDILCYAETLQTLEGSIWEQFRNRSGFSLRRWVSEDRPVVAEFRADGWTFQIFGSRTPVRAQIGWSLFEAELRIMEIGGDSLKTDISLLRKNGLKTIPAIARLLGFDGDPYQALLATKALSKETLTDLVLNPRRPNDR